jgi:hypothetical protein
LGILQVAVSIALLAVALASFHWSALGNAIDQLTLTACGLAGIFVILSVLLTGVRWYALARRVVPGKLLWHLDHYFRATLLNAVTPANIGGDVYRLLMLRRDFVGTMPVALLLIRERYIGLLSYCIMYLLAFAAIAAWDPGLVRSKAAILIPFAFVAAGAVFAMGLAPWILRWFSRLADGTLARYAASAANLMLEVVDFQSGAQFCVVLGLSLLAVSSWAIAILIISDAVGIALWLPIAMAVGVAVELARWIPISVQGIGVRESLYAWLLGSLAAIPGETGFVIGATVYVILSAATVVLGGAFATLGALRTFLSRADSTSTKTGL